MALEPLMKSLSREQLNDALIRFNVLRTWEPSDPITQNLLDGALEALFSPSRHLIVYGSMAPEGPNHGLISHLEGEWREGWVTGELMERGWGAAMGYPALRWWRAASPTSTGRSSCRDTFVHTLRWGRRS